MLGEFDNRRQAGAGEKLASKIEEQRRTQGDEIASASQQEIETPAVQEYHKQQDP